MTPPKFDLTEADRQQLIAWNSTQARHPCGGGGIHELFETQVRQTPDVIALVAGSHQLTYRELNQRANQLAHYLQSLGVKADSLVGICVERDPLMIIGMLGILKAGGAYVPLDPAYPKERLQFMLANAEAAVLLTSDHLLSMLSQTAHIAHVVCLDSDWETISGERDENTGRLTSPNHLAYVIYTSGSTGQPKGVAMEHRSLTNLLCWHAQTRPASRGLKTLQFCAISFDFSVHEIFATLCFGGTLVLMTEEVRRNPFALAKFINDNKIEKLFLPVTALQQLAEAVDSETISTTLREVVTTGEQLQITPAMVSLFSRTGALLHNHYGATEFQDATTFTLSGEPMDWPALPPVGRPLSNVQIYILDELEQVPIGEPGELYIGGAGVARGYFNRPELTKEKFIPNPFGAGRLYKTGDLARYRTDGMIENLGRTDDQVKIRGIRIEPGEIEAVLARHPAVRESVVMAQGMNHKRLVAYLVVRQKELGNRLEARLHRYLCEHLPDTMLPEAFVLLDEMPLTPSGKINRLALPAPQTFRRTLKSPLAMPQSETERLLVEIWQEVLQLEAVGIHDKFFDIGATSLLLIQVHQKLIETLDRPLPALTLFQYPTIKALAQYLSQQQKPEEGRQKSQKHLRPGRSDVAIIGMSGRFPGAGDIDVFWRNLCEGVESISFFSDEETEQNDPMLLNNPNYIKAGAVLSNIKGFDASFFGISPKEAATMDPQHRLFLECAWEAFEHAGYNPETYSGTVGVYGGASISTYLINNVSQNLGYSANRPLIEADMLQFQVKLGNDGNYLPTRVSYKLDLKGPSVNVQTACSTSLVAVHLACQSVLSGESHMALAGGVSIVVPDKGGYLYEESMIRSPDGHCRAFDAQAAGTLFGSGGGIVLLKRLDDALADGDHITAVIKGTAINNDGALKVGFTAPSLERQVDVIKEALAVAEVDAGTITYIEAHGTGTQLGDPIEIAALTQAFHQSSQEELSHQYCAVGSVKTNIGHLDEAAGIAGLIKTALALKHKQIPPSLHFNQPNPQIDFENSPFYVKTEFSEWTTNGTPRRAGISSFGMGGTNSHIVLEEAPDNQHAVAMSFGKSANEQTVERPLHLLTLSAQNEPALQEMVKQYVDYLSFPTKHEANLADICFTANTGRKHFSHRLAVVAQTNEQLRAQLELFLNSGAGGQTIKAQAGKVAFLFTGQGSQYVDMGRKLYETQPLFRERMAQCDLILQSYLEMPLLEILYGEAKEDNNKLLSQTQYTQPALFAIEYALAKLWQSWGIEPTVVMGHSVGEYVAACIAGVFSLADGLKLVAERGRLIQALPQNGIMAAVQADETKLSSVIEPYRSQVSMAGLNAPQSVVLSGEREAVNQIVAQLQTEGIKCKLLEVSHAFHSPLMEPMLAEFEQVAQQVTYSEPKIKFISNVTGDLASHEFTTADYWVRHVRQPVRFATGMESLERQSANLFMEIGPKPILLGMGRQCLPEDEAVLWLPGLCPKQDDWQQLLSGLRDLYLAGVPVDWVGFEKGYVRGRAPLPTYPWQRECHWIEARNGNRRQKNRGHPLIGQALHMAHRDEILFHGQVSKAFPAWLSDHRVFQSMVMPGVAYLEMALAAGVSAFNTESLMLSDFTMQRAMDWPNEDEEKTIQVVLQSEEAQRHALQIFSRGTVAPDTITKPSWSLHASARLHLDSQTGSRRHKFDIRVPKSGKSLTATGYKKPISQALNLADLQTKFTNEISVDLIYQGEREREIDLGPSFRATERLWRKGTSCLSKISLPKELLWEAEAYQVHPVLLEACFLALTVTCPEKYGSKNYVPSGVEHLQWKAYSGTEMWCHAELDPAESDDPELLKADIRLFAPDGSIILVMEGVLLKIASRQAMLQTQESWRSWLYKVTWKSQNRVGKTATTGHWLILADHNVGPEVGRLLHSQGASHTLLFVGEQYEQTDHQIFTINPARPKAFQQFLRTLPDLQSVVNCWSLENTANPLDTTADLARGLLNSCANTLYLIQALITLPVSPQLWLITQGALAINDYPVRDVISSSQWGIGKVITLEHPELKCIQIDLDPEAIPDLQAETLFLELQSSPDTPQQTSPIENQVAFRRQKRYVARLAHYRNESKSEFNCRSDSSYLITGGLGGLGIKAARFLVEHGARHLVLVGRSGANSFVQEQLGQFEALGAKIIITQADVSDREQVAQVLNQIERHLPLRGIMHLAGVLNDGVLQQQSWERFEQVMAPKVMGAWNLHTLTKNHHLDFFVLFSSITSLLGTAGQANYAAANAFLDGLASYRRAQGLPALSINWGSWAEAGMSARLGFDELMKQKGEGTIAPQQGLDILEALLTDEAHQVGVMPIDWPLFLEKQLVPQPFFSNLQNHSEPLSKSPAPIPAHHPSAGGNHNLRQQLESVPAKEALALLQSHVGEQVAQVLGVSVSALLEEQDAGFATLGIDSLTSIELRNRLQISLACSLPSTLAFDYPTQQALVDYLAQELLESSVLAAEDELYEEHEMTSLDDAAQLLAAELGVEL
ncbi:MAG: amino acid adenylation domain-containing protein [Gammaproteobacteria bacterium]|nr:amino acid adenylation domain-containing protein [Gammaproteobacteria bacterium]